MKVKEKKEEERVEQGMVEKVREGGEVCKRDEVEGKREEMKELSAVKEEKKRGVKEEVKEVRRREAEGTRHPKGKAIR